MKLFEILLAAVLLNISTAQYGSDEHFTASAEMLANEFIDTFKEAVRSSDQQKLMELLHKSLVFHGCNDGFNRSTMVKMLLNLSEEQKKNVKVELDMAEFFSDWDIALVAKVNGVKCGFHVQGGRQQMMLKECPEERN